jgi:dihydroorotate dehydrogenase (fumarate)
MLATTIAEYELTNCIWNAAGVHCTTREDLEGLGDSEAGLILSKSCTLESREGNPGPRYFHQCHTKSPNQPNLTINSTGLANHGYKFYGDMANYLRPVYDKPYFVSVSGLSKADNLEILHYMQETSVDGIELNLSCPNVPGKPQIGYDFEATDQFLREIYEEVDQTIPLGLKLPPYFDPCHIQNMSEIITEYPLSFVTCINSLGNGLILEPVAERPVIKPKSGLGGIGGSVVKPFALANVFQFSQALGDSGIQVIGCGGVRNGWDAFEHILVGASAVQVGSTLYEEGPQALARISSELKEIMTNKGYQTIEDFRGRLKPF